MLTAHRFTWILVLRGIAAILFGVLAMNQTGLAVKFFIMLFAVYALFDGAAAIIGSLAARTHHHDWWLMLLAGVLSAAVGVMTLARPGVTALILMLFIAARALIVGVLEISLALGVRRAKGNWLLLLVSGLISILFGLALFSSPLEGAVAIVWVIGAFAIMYGGAQLAMAIQVSRWNKHPKAA